MLEFLIEFLHIFTLFHWPDFIQTELRGYGRQDLQDYLNAIDSDEFWKISFQCEGHRDLNTLLNL